MPSDSPVNKGGSLRASPAPCGSPFPCWAIYPGPCMSPTDRAGRPAVFVCLPGRAGGVYLCRDVCRRAPVTRLLVLARRAALTAAPPAAGSSCDSRLRSRRRYRLSHRSPPPPPPPSAPFTWRADAGWHGPATRALPLMASQLGPTVSGSVSLLRSKACEDGWSGLAIR